MKNIRKILAALLIALFCLSVFPALAESAVVTTARVNLRSGVGTGNDVITVIPAGTRVSFDKSSNDELGTAWYRVSYNGRTGWISSKYTQKSDSGYTANKITTTGRVYLRSGAGINYSALKTVGKGEVFPFTAAVKDDRGVTWYKVSYEGSTGWISSVYARLDETSAAKVIASGDVHVRSEANLNGKSLAVIKKGQTAEFLNASAMDNRGVTWYKVRFDGVTGWVSTAYARLA